MNKILSNVTTRNNSLIPCKKDASDQSQLFSRKICGENATPSRSGTKSNIWGAYDRL